MSGDTDKRGVGRPSDYRPEFCDVVIEIGSQGGWICEMAEACDVDRRSFYRWTEAHPEFRTALSRAKQKAQAWFEREGREGLKLDRFNATLWQKQMQARHREEYTERREMTGAEGGPIKTEETGSGAAKLAAFLANVAERSGSTGEPGA